MRGAARRRTGLSEAPMMFLPMYVTAGGYDATDVLTEDVPPNVDKTTVMWKNIPNNCSRDDLLELMNTEGFAGCYNFFYSPVDFASSALLGYAFVNFVSPKEASRFLYHFQGYSRWRTGSEK